MPVKKILTNKAKVALRQFEQAVRDDETKRIQEPSDRKEIADLLKVKRNNLMRMLPSDTEFKKIVEEQTRLHGAYVVTKICRDVFKEISIEYKNEGNHNAIIHTDCAIIENAMYEMISGHQLRMKGN